MQDYNYHIIRIITLLFKCYLPKYANVMKQMKHKLPENCGRNGNCFHVCDCCRTAEQTDVGWERRLQARLALKSIEQSNNYDTTVQILIIKYYIQCILLVLRYKHKPFLVGHFYSCQLSLPLLVVIYPLIRIEEQLIRAFTGKLLGHKPKLSLDL